jgi:saccharopine dehydrogenase-like NADP-dependent oxidoreductase
VAAHARDATGPSCLARRFISLGRAQSVSLVRPPRDLFSTSQRRPRALMRTVFVLGGYGFFGRRIAAALASTSDWKVILAGRDADRAAAAARELGLPAGNAAAIDARDRELGRTLQRFEVDLLIHAAGPFQDQDYAVARAAIEAGCDYVDLADGRQFVAGIGTLAAAAEASGVSVISGASSVPALSSAVVDRYLDKFERLDSIDMGISSGARAPGLATVVGVFSYGGKAIRSWRDGAWDDAHGWLNLHRHEFPPPLGKRWLGSCDVPDLELFPRRYPSVKTVSFQAGFASDLGHLAVWGLAGLVRIGVLRSMKTFAVPLNRLSRWLEPMLSDRGGMFVSLRGQGSQQQPLTITWNLIAQQNHGPYIPCGAAIALARKVASGGRLPKGAMPCMGLLTVEEFLEPLRDLDIYERVN